MEEKELDHLREVFQAIDIDHTGAINRDELLECFKKAGIKTNSDEVDKMIKRIQDSQPGKIIYSEFLIAAMDIKKNVDKEKLISAFSYFDVDKTGLISTEDIENAFLRSGKKILDSEEIKSIIVEATKGKETTSISLDEFLNMFGIKQ